MSQKWKELDSRCYKVVLLTDFSMFVTELKEIDSRYYKVVLLTEFGTFVTKMEGARFHVL